MAWKSMTIRNMIDIKKHEDKPFGGVYTGFKKITTKIGEQVIWRFQPEDGDSFGIYGFTNLNLAMKDIAEGETVRITYKGTKNMQTKFGLKDVHMVEVETYEEDEPVNQENPLGVS